MKASAAAPSLAAALVVAFGLAAPALGKVVRLEVIERAPLAEGRAFGLAGGYERIVGRLHYAVDPANPHNRGIVDLERAPRDARGRVAFTGDFVLLKPVDLARGNHRLLYDVTNRGGLVALGVLDEAPWSNRPTSAADSGNGFLLEQGYSLLWSAWNWDVLPGAGRLQIELPIATEGGRPIIGPVAAEIVLRAPTGVTPVAWGNSRGYAPADPDEVSAELTVRTTPEGERRLLRRDVWRFVLPKPPAAGPVAISLDGGFRPGLIYEVVYTARDPRVVGLGLAAIRDAIAFFRFEPTDEGGFANPLAGDASAAIAFGVSQSGRAIQHMLLEGLHVDEAGRMVFDAALVHVAGGGKGDFNRRFAQTTRHPSAVEDHLYPVDVFPFATVEDVDPATGVRASVLDRARTAGKVPRLFYINTSTEYWTRSASLLHVDVAGERDQPLDSSARLYVLAGAHHGSGPWASRPEFAECGNPVDHGPALRALLWALDRWITSGETPPESVYPRIADGTLGTVAAYRKAFPAIPGFGLPEGNLRPLRLDLGPRFAGQGIADLQPAKAGAPYRTLVPLPDADGIDRGGIRLPEVAVPLGTVLGWNLWPAAGDVPASLGRWEGSFLPFAVDEAARHRAGDPRPSLAARYATRDAYLERVDGVMAELAARGFLLPADMPAIRQRAARAYDSVVERRDDASCDYLAAFAAP